MVLRTMQKEREECLEAMELVKETFSNYQSAKAVFDAIHQIYDKVRKDMDKASLSVATANDIYEQAKIVEKAKKEIYET